jgi:hypothetical protein
MPLERRTTFNFCSSSLDESQLQATGFFGTGSLRRHATIGMIQQLSSLHVHAKGTPGESCASGSSSRFACSGMHTPIEVPSRPPGMSVVDWRQMGMLTLSIFLLHDRS